MKTSINKIYLWCLIIAVSFLLVLKACKNPVQQGTDVTLLHNDSILELSNGLVKSQLLLKGPVIAQSFFAISDGKWELILNSLDRRSQPDKKVMPLYDNNPKYTNDLRLMVQEGLQSVKILNSDKQKAQVILSGSIGKNKIEQVITLNRDQDFFHIEVNATLDKPELEYLLSSFAFSPGSEPDFSFTPSVKRSDDDVIGDRKFFAPATILEKNGLFAALVPDLDMINEYKVFAKGARPQKHPRIFAVPVDTNKVSFPTGMDLCLSTGITNNPVLSYGYLDYWVEQHVYWRHENQNGAQVRILSDNHLKFGFDLFLKAGVEKYRGYQRISSYLWKRYGTRYFHEPRPQVVPFAEYAKICYPASFEYQGYDVTPGPTITHRSGKSEMATWQQWSNNGVQVGGLRLSAPQWYQFIYNTAWWNNVCDATGIYFWGKKLNDSLLIDKARRIVRFTLSAPQNEGLFPSLYNIKEGTWQPSLWNPPMNGYDPDKVDSYWGWDQNKGVYQTASASVTAGFLMHYRQHCENDTSILPFVMRYGEFLIRNIKPNGCIPGWFSKTLDPLPSLLWNADGGAHIWVLSELFSATGEKKFADAAEKIAAFMINEVMPHQKWYDFETFYSCAVKPETFYDSRTGQYPANNMSVSWALEGFASLYEVTQKSEYMDAAQAIADYSLFYQAVWAPHYIVTAYPYGGFSSQNSDAEWLDQRSHRFTNGLMRVGLLAGREDLTERAVAAARSSLALVNLPLSIQNDVYKFPNYPLGLGPENIDHEGFPQMPLRSGPSWCEIGGLAAAAHLLDRLGGVYINFEKKIALGIDGIALDSYSIRDNRINIGMRSLLSELKVPYNKAFTVEMKIEGLPEQNYEVIINDSKPIKATIRDLVKLHLTVEPGDNFKIEM